MSRVKSLPFIPLAYIAGAHGFALFAPYAAFVLMIVLIKRRKPIAI